MRTNIHRISFAHNLAENGYEQVVEREPAPISQVVARLAVGQMLTEQATRSVTGQ